MAHEIESVAYQGETPWHGLGVQVDQEVGKDYQRFLIAAGLDWKVERVPVITKDKLQDTNGYAAIRRLTDEKVLGVVGPKFVPLQNEKAFEWFKPFVEAGEAEFHTAGSLRGGSRVWILAKLNREPIVVTPGDTIDKFLLLAHGHDGSLAVRVGFTPVRVVCANTLALAREHSASKLIKVRHTKSVEQALLNISETINTIDAAFEATGEQYRKLANKAISQADVVRYVKIVFEVPEEFETKLAEKRASDLVNDVLARVYSGRGNDGGNLWSAYNGVTEFLSYSQGRTQETRLNSLWFGQSALVNQRAFETALDLVAA